MYSAALLFIYMHDCGQAFDGYAQICYDKFKGA